MTGHPGVVYKKWVMGADDRSGDRSGDGMGDMNI